MLKTLFVIGLCIYGLAVTWYALRSGQFAGYEGKHRRGRNNDTIKRIAKYKIKRRSEH